MENLLVQLHISRRHGNPTNCSERRFWQFSCGNLRCRLCHQGPLDLRGHIRSSSAGLLGWSLLVQEPVGHPVYIIPGSFLVKGHLGSTGQKFPYQNRSEFLDILTLRGGAVLPEHIDLEQLLAKKSKMGDGAPMIRVVVGNNYGQNTDGSPKPIRAMLEERIKIRFL